MPNIFICNLGQLCSSVACGKNVIINRFQPFLSVFSGFQQISTSFNQFHPILTSLNCFQLFSAIFRCILPLSTVSSLCQPFLTIFLKIASVLLSAQEERFNVSHMQDFSILTTEDCSNILYSPVDC